MNLRYWEYNYNSEIGQLDQISYVPTQDSINERVDWLTLVKLDKQLAQILTAASSAVQLMYVNIASSCEDKEKSANKFSKRGGRITYKET